MNSREPMKLRWWRTDQTRKPIRVEFTRQEVSDLAALVAYLADQTDAKNRIDDPQLRELVERCLSARQAVHDGHTVIVFVPS